MLTFLQWSAIMERFHYLDLASVALAIASIGIMGFVVYFNDPKSATNQAFLFFTLMTALYGTANYFSYQPNDSQQVLWLLRVTLAGAILHAFSFFHLFFVFPKREVIYPGGYWLGAFGAAVCMAIFSLSPYIFKNVYTVAETGATNPVHGLGGYGIGLFGFLATAYVLFGIFWLLRNAYGHTSDYRQQSRIVLFGGLFTFALIVTFNFILPTAFQILDFISLVPVFFLPFIIATSHAIRKYHFLDVKVITIELLTFVLAVIMLIEIIVADDLSALLLSLATFSLVLLFGILLIRSVINEIEQREHLEKMTRELTDANIRLKQLDKVRSEFLSFASHQVKAPMSVVKGYAQLIGDGTFGTVSEQVADTARKIKESADRLISLVNNLLDLRRIEEGRMEFSFSDLDIIPIVKNVVEDLSPLADRKGIRLTTQLPDMPLRARLDETKFRQVIQNLVDNSIKYTEEGFVNVQLLARDKYISIEISDTGRGIPEDLLPQLFEQFTREKDAGKRIEGTGLGLYIAKQIVVAHQGTITAASEGPGKGSTFTVTIPPQV